MYSHTPCANGRTVCSSISFPVGRRGSGISHVHAGTARTARTTCRLFGARTSAKITARVPSFYPAHAYTPTLTVPVASPLIRFAFQNAPAHSVAEKHRRRLRNTTARNAAVCFNLTKLSDRLPFRSTPVVSRVPCNGPQLINMPGECFLYVRLCTCCVHVYFCASV